MSDMMVRHNDNVVRLSASGGVRGRNLFCIEIHGSSPHIQVLESIYPTELSGSLLVS